VEGLEITWPAGVFFDFILEHQYNYTEEIMVRIKINQFNYTE
jgi:hypothetical protein